MTPSAVSPRSFASFRDCHAGGTIVVCGCGSSLNELEQPERFVTIGVNDVGRKFDPDYLVVVDPKDRFKDDRFHYVETSRAKHVFTQLGDLGVRPDQRVVFRLGRKGGTDFADPDILHYSVVTPYVALCLAAHMGARRIGMIGVDFTDDHFFGKTGRHAWSAHLTSIEEDFARLYSSLRARAVAVFNLSRASRVSVFPKMDLAVFAGLPPVEAASRQTPLRIVSYATTPVVGVPSILARCINARTVHAARSAWRGGDYATGATHDGDLDWVSAPDRVAAEIDAADLVILHNGKLDPRHRAAVADKAVLTLAHNYMSNVDQGFVRQGFPGLVVGQYAATLPEFADWSVVPNPVPLWERAFAPESKNAELTICYTPADKHEIYPAGHPLYWHGKGYTATMAVLDRLSARFPLRIEAIRDRHLPHGDILAMKRRAHIVIDECVTGSYHRNSLEGLACGCVVVNGVGLLPGVAEILGRCGGEASSPFVFADLDSLETCLTGLIEQGRAALAAQGRRGRAWMERYWRFDAQWDRFWRPAAERAIAQAQAQARRKPIVLRRAPLLSTVPGVSVVIPSLNEGDLLRHTVQAIAASLPKDGEIIVVDDGSSDGSADFLSTPMDQVTLLRPQHRLGSAGARNFGAAHASGRILAFSDAHVAPQRDWATKLLVPLENPDVGAVMPAMRSLRYPEDYGPDGGESAQTRGYGMRWTDAGLGVAWLGRQRSGPYPVPLLGAAFLAMRRNLFAAVGGFDPGLEIWGAEDAELSLRLWTLGFECLVVPGVEAAHKFRSAHPYRVPWESVLYNKLRLASIHFSPARAGRVIDRLSANAAYPAASDKLAASDAAALGERLRSSRRYDDDWFFARFKAELTPELAVG
jgi:GT2 family glycosyltransferase